MDVLEDEFTKAVLCTGELQQKSPLHWRASYILNRFYSNH